MGLRLNDPRPCSVYRWFAPTGQLLYVGAALDPDKRWNELRNAEEWPRFAAWRTVEWYETVREALAAEQDAIKTEGPLLNMHGKERHYAGALPSSPYRELPLGDGTVVRMRYAGPGWIVGDRAIAAYEAQMGRGTGSWVSVATVCSGHDCDCRMSLPRSG